MNQNIILSICIFWCTSLLSQVNVNPDYSKQPVKVSDKSVEFSGWYGNYTKQSKLSEIRLGFFLPENSDNLFHSSINNAADLAIEEINTSGGYHGVPFHLVRRWADDPWGAGSKEMIKLVYKDSVWAVIGSLNGDATHIAEQVVTKAFVPLISPISADPTLNYIRIPWMFRLPPDFQRQAKIIVEQGIIKQAIKNVGLITTADHDGRTFANEIKESLGKINQALAFHFQVSTQKFNISDIVNRALNFRTDALILYLHPQDIEQLYLGLRKNESQIPVFIPWIHDFDNKENKKYKNLFLIEPFTRASNSSWAVFEKKYYRQFKTNPTTAAAFTYDAVYLLANAIEKSGLNRAAIRDAIAETDYLNPVTGKISWDNTGSNNVQPVLRQMDKQ